MLQETGTISINTENIFPIIKKFLYSDHEIFLRELVSNAVDATQKMKRLSSLGHYNKDLGDLRVKVAVDEKAKTITVSDSGIGMTAEEIKKYINQIAFSGATEFMKNSRKPRMPMRSLAVLVSGFIPHLWWLTRSRYRHCLTRMGLNPRGGSVMEVLLLKSLKEPVRNGELM